MGMSFLEKDNWWPFSLRLITAKNSTMLVTFFTEASLMSVDESLMCSF